MSTFHEAVEQLDALLRREEECLDFAREERSLDSAREERSPPLTPSEVEGLRLVEPISQEIT